MVQLTRYAMTGGTAAVVDIGLFLLLITLGGAVFLSACASFLVAAAVNYVLTSSFVFRVQRRTSRQALQFMLFVSLGFVLNTGLTTVFHQAGLAPTLAKAAAVGMVFFCNFFVNRNVVFSELNVDSPDSSPRFVAGVLQRLDRIVPGKAPRFGPWQG